MQHIANNLSIEYGSYILVSNKLVESKLVSMKYLDSGLASYWNLEYFMFKFCC
jgi:hypothetical protein